MADKDFDDIHLPDGWIEEWHDSGHPYYVDTRANPPRSIWVHPYEDEEYLRAHPEDRGKHQFVHASAGEPPQYDEKYRADQMSSQVKTGEAQEYLASRGVSSGGTASRSLEPGTRGFFGGQPSIMGVAPAMSVSAVPLAPVMAAPAVPLAPPMFRRQRGILGIAGGIRDGLGIPDRRLMRHEAAFQRRMERRGAYVPQYAAPQTLPPQYIAPQYVAAAPQYAVPVVAPQYAVAAPPPPIQNTSESHHHGGKVMPFLGGMASGVVIDEIVHHMKK